MTDHIPNGQILWPNDERGYRLNSRVLPAQEAARALAEAHQEMLLHRPDWAQGRAGVGAGLATLAIQQELAAVRAELHTASEALQGLAAALTTGIDRLTAEFRLGCAEIAQRIPDDMTDRITDSVAELRDELCTEVAEAGALHQTHQARRSWWRPWRPVDGGDDQ
ncbi:hypothetical protein [Actinomadura harenae]|uniref:Uncharacterized protein n=1 Tax=Actinomadura harenae TaxID=2483351 RepID=A0A3M2M761_9ACTN|nr:hypothetical protein [Actinomadura harenae]RMI45309.1 hypothetical protein EBO15_10305 [Actinomadura harenae]